MVTTMRGLAEILPPPKKHNFNPILFKKSKPKPKYFSPYLEPNPKPKLPESKLLPRPAFPPADLYPYHVWNNPDYVVQNEEMRWFARASEHPRIVAPIKTSGEKIVDAFLDEQIDNITSKNYDKSQIIEGLCLKHKNKSKEDRRTELLKKLFEEKPRDFTSEIEKEVVHQIELDVAATQEEFQCLAKQFQTQVIVGTIIQDMLTNAAAIQYIQPCKDCRACHEDLDLYKNLLSRRLSYPPCPGTPHNSIAEDETECQECEEKWKRFNYGNHGTFNEQEKYFHSPVNGIPYEFDYGRIFHEDFLKSEKPIKKGIRKAFELDEFKSVDAAIQDWIHKAWKYELEMWNEKQRQDEEELERQEKEKESKPKEYEIKDTRSCIRILLKDHLAILRKDPKYVLASLPDAWDLPMLHEFVRQFYGFKTSREERKRQIRKNMFEWNYIVEAHPAIKVPNNLDICPGKSSLSYDYRNRLGNISNLLRKNFDDEFKKEFMDMNRIHWKSFQPYFCNPRFREVFYAYFPGCERELHTFRPYNKNLNKIK